MPGRCLGFHWVAGLAVVMALAGCQGSSSGGGGGGTTATPPPVFPGLGLNITVTSATIDNGLPVVEFQVTDQAGVGVPLTQAALSSGALGFGLAKLVPGDGPRNADSWQSYINKKEIPTAGVGPNGTPVDPLGDMQATTESGGILTNLGGGLHRYQFQTDVTKPAQTMGVTYDPSLTHRLIIQAQFIGANGRLIAANAHFDFVPNGAAVTQTKLVATTASCNSCHAHLSAHGGRSVEVETCVACHNPGTTDANSGNNLDMVVMVHKIHMGKDLTKGYTVWGDGDVKDDFSDVAYPQDHRNCVKCHDGSNPATPDGDNWETRPTQQACGACHDDLDFSTHQFGFAPGDNRFCAGCHVSDISTAPEIIQTAHRMYDRIAAGWFKYNILGVTQTKPGQMPQVTFEVVDPRNGTSYDILHDPRFSAANGARLAVVLGWDTLDYSNNASGAVTGSPTTFPAPGQPVSINALTSAVDTGGLVFMVQSPVPVPTGTRGTGVAAIEGHPAAIVDPINNPGVYKTVPVDNVFRYFSITDLVAQPRRQIVSLAKCNNCHDRLSLHGGNRQGAVEVCVICHNPYATDISQRPATIDTSPADGTFDNFAAVGVDGKREQNIHFKNMIHAIHAGEADKHGFRTKGITVMGYGRSVNDFSDVRFPGVLENCDTCHLDGTYQLPTPYGALGTTVQTANPALAGNQPSINAALANQADDLKISPTASLCSSCHDSASTQQHIIQTGGGSFSATQAVIIGTVLEACGGCHGPGEIEDISVVHAVQPLP